MQTPAVTTKLPSQLLQALNALQGGVQGDAQQDGGDFLLRLTSQLEQLEAALPDADTGAAFWPGIEAQMEQIEEIAAQLQELAGADDLAAWLAAGLGGDGLPAEGKDLPLPVGFPPEAIRDVQEPARDPGAAHQARLLAAAVHLAATGHQAASGAAAAVASLDGDAPDLRARVADMLAELRALTGTAETDPRRGGSAPLPGLAPGLSAAAQAAATGLPVPPYGLNTTGFTVLPATVTAGSAEGRAVLEAAAFAARVSDAAAQPAAAAGIAALSVDGVAGGQPGSANPLATRGFSLDVPLQQPGWDRAFANSVRWMVNQNVQVAEMRLSPPHLGPLEVRLQMDGDRTHVNIVAPHASTREAVEAALPRLREMFAESGLTLGDVNVRQQNAGRGDAEGDAQSGQASADTAGGAEDADGHSPGGSLTSQGLVDFYA